MPTDPRALGAPAPGSPTRRRFLAQAGVAGAVAWTAPVVLSMHTPAAAGTCCSSSAVATLIAACQTNLPYSPDGVCTVFSDTTATVCRKAPNQKIVLSRDGAGTQEPYFDELGILTVTPPTGPAVTWNFIRWQDDCRDQSAANTVNLTSAGDQQCSPTGLPAVDISAMFGSQCGVFSLRLQVVNKYSPYGWGQTFVVPL